jgi:hypothetical protein
MKCRRWAEVLAFEELEARAGIGPVRLLITNKLLILQLNRIGKIGTKADR